MTCSASALDGPRLASDTLGCAIVRAVRVKPRTVKAASRPPYSIVKTITAS